MKFGLFGSAKAVRGDVDIDSLSGYKEWLNYNVEAESLGFYSSLQLSITLLDLVRFQHP